MKNKELYCNFHFELHKLIANFAAEIEDLKTDCSKGQSPLDINLYHLLNRWLEVNETEYVFQEEYCEYRVISVIAPTLTIAFEMARNAHNGETYKIVESSTTPLSLIREQSMRPGWAVYSFKKGVPTVIECMDDEEDEEARVNDCLEPEAGDYAT